MVEILEISGWKLMGIAHYAIRFVQFCDNSLLLVVFFLALRQVEFNLFQLAYGLVPIEV